MEEKPQIDLASVDSINNIDTARMALRWALERLHVLESAKAEATERMGREAKWRAQAEEEGRQLKTALRIKASETEERARYYKKVEEFLSLRLAGQVDIAALAQRETELDQLRQDLEGRLVLLEREFAARRQSLELEYQRLTRQARETAQAGAQEAQASLAKRHEEFEKDHADKLVSLKEREVRIARQEAELAERQRRFDEFCAAEKVRTEADARQLLEQGQARLRAAERILEERQSALETGWTKEKALLMQELALMRRKVQELGPALLESDRRAEELAEALVRGQEAARRAEQKARLTELDSQAAIQRLRELEARAEADIAARSDLERRAQTAEANAREAQAELETDRLRLQKTARALESALDAWQRRADEATQRGAELEGRLAEAEGRAQTEAGLAKAEVARHRSLEERQKLAERLWREEWEAEHKSLLDRIAGLEDSLRRVRDEGEARLHKAAAEAQAALAEVERRHQEKERASQELRQRAAQEFEERLQSRSEESSAAQAALGSEVAAWRQRADEATQRGAELEGRLAEAKGRAQTEAELANAEVARHRALEEREKLAERLWQEEWGAEHKSLLDRIAGLEGSLQRARDEGEARLQKAAAEAQAAQAALGNEVATWQRRADEATQRSAELEGRLAEAEGRAQTEVERAKAEVVRRRSLEEREKLP